MDTRTLYMGLSLPPVILSDVLRQSKTLRQEKCGSNSNLFKKTKELRLALSTLLVDILQAISGSLFSSIFIDPLVLNCFYSFVTRFLLIEIQELSWWLRKQEFRNEVVHKYVDYNTTVWFRLNDVLYITLNSVKYYFPNAKNDLRVHASRCPLLLLPAPPPPTPSNIHLLPTALKNYSCIPGVN